MKAKNPKSGSRRSKDKAGSKTAADSNVKLRDRVLEEGRQGNVVFATLDGYAVAPLDEFVQQPVEGILYDLNRLPEVVLTFIDDPKWVNDFAVQMVIKRLREKLDDKV